MSRTSLKLRCQLDELKIYSKRYSYKDDEEVISLEDGIRDRGYIQKNELLTIAHWKSPRSAGHIDSNTEDYVREITGFALSAKSERARIESLTMLDGVKWPTASVLLHLYHRNPYPIMDYRVLWTMSLEVPTQYTYPFWHDYTEVFRELMASTGLRKRELDRGLWQYSKENQKKRSMR